MEKKRYAHVGIGGRARMYYQAIAKKFSDTAELVAFCDINQTRMDYANRILVDELGYHAVPTYTPDQFEKMIEETKPDTVIVTTVDATHDRYAIAAMEAGCDVIVEKPLTTTFEKALAIKAAQEKTKKDVTVTFNLRFHPFYKRIKEIIKSGAVGEVLSVHFEWLLNTNHGADYFRRWHSRRECSGSLLVHKSTHHFDLINWFLEEDPLYVNAFGSRRFYGPTREERSERCLTCPYKGSCEVFKDISAGKSLRPRM